MKVVLCTVPAEAAESLARALVAGEAAACVNALPGVRSVYRWQGAVETAEETLLVVKTSDDALPRLAARIRALHPYTLPEIVALDASWADSAYAEWVDRSTRAAHIPHEDRKTREAAADERVGPGALPARTGSRFTTEDSMAAKKKAAKKPAKKKAAKKKK